MKRKSAKASNGNKSKEEKKPDFARLTFFLFFLSAFLLAVRINQQSVTKREKNE